MSDKPNRVYRLYSGDQKPPDHARVLATLSDDELCDEVQHERGDSAYRKAAREEYVTRGLHLKGA